MKIEDFKKTYAINVKRINLYDKLIEVISYLKDHSNLLLIIIHGSYITNEPLPNDIDLLIDLCLNEKGIELLSKNNCLKLPPINPNEIHVKGNYKTNSIYLNKLDTSENLINAFNNNIKNKENLIKISNYLILEL